MEPNQLLLAHPDQMGEVAPRAAMDLQPRVRDSPRWLRPRRDPRTGTLCDARPPYRSIVGGGDVGGSLRRRVWTSGFSAQSVREPTGRALVAAEVRVEECCRGDSRQVVLAAEVAASASATAPDRAARTRRSRHRHARRPGAPRSGSFTAATISSMVRASSPSTAYSARKPRLPRYATPNLRANLATA